MSMPLQDVRVLDLTRVLAGPYCTMMLGDMGAEILKIEEPDRGEEYRGMQVPGREGFEDFFYLLNRNKRSITVNLKSARGKQVIYDLAAKVDVVVENFSPGVAARLGVDFEKLSALNPALVYCSISGFGQNGPYRDRKAYDPVVQALAGVMSVTGFPSGPPLRPGLFFSDVAAGMVASYAILAALMHSRRTGQGQQVDVAMLDTLVSMWASSAVTFLATGLLPERLGNDIPHRCPADSYRAKDGRYIQLLASSQPLWVRLCELLGVPEWGNDPRFDSEDKRIRRREEVNSLVSSRIEQRNADEWDRILGDGGIPCGRVNNLQETFSDPHILAREMLLSVEHPVAGSVPQIGMPYKLSATPAAIRKPPPLLGQDTEDVLAGLLGYTAEQIDGLRQEGVVSGPTV